LKEREKVKLKNLEIKIVAELMKNSRRSDRELAKAIGTSQPTISRTIKKLEKQGVIREYTMIPDFKQLGYEIMGITFIGGEENLKKEEDAEIKRAVKELENKNPYASLIAVNGIGFGRDRMFITLYRDYARYVEAMQMTKSIPHVKAEGLMSFLVDLKDEGNYRVLTLEQVARNIQTFAETLTEKSA
jgi:DNA-binding Lrp family transcriptional regulator